MQIKEKIPCKIFSHSQEANIAVATEIADLIRARESNGQSCVLGLATGSTPVGVYNELVRMHREEGLSFQNVITFNLDEYYPMQPQELQSYVRFMNEHLFDHVDIPRNQVNIPDGTIRESEIEQFCIDYEARIQQAGGIDLQLLGIGRTGHIGFNEPGSGKDSLTRLITLDRITRLDAASDFFGEQNVPRRAVTMGVGTILAARRVIIMAFGEHKALIVQQTVEGDVTPAIPATFLQSHFKATFFLDSAASQLLSRTRKPWVYGNVEWTPETIRKAVILLARQCNKAILKLTDADYNEDDLQDLLAKHGPAYNINLAVFRHLQSTITGWPGGKPAHAKQPGDRPQTHEEIFPKRVLVFSPHPDDDVISMGGTLLRLVEQGHEVHVAYQTSGNIAVFDDDAIRFAEFAAELTRTLLTPSPAMDQLESHIEEFVKNKKAGQVDSPEVQKIKGIIRRGEARAATRYCGIPESQLHFLDMPFYETGRVKKKPLGEEDISMIEELINRLKPHQIYAAGDLSDPHGTHRVCLSAILQACQRVQTQDWYKQCVVWLYRGAWHEWEPHEIEMAVPLSPLDVMKKRISIFKHQSQKDRALFPGNDAREFWKRAEDRNSETAKLYDRLGLAEYEAIEGFVRWKGSLEFV